jgi:multiple antibiotic resistance protein
MAEGAVLETAVYTFALLFVAVDPIGNAPLFLGLTGGTDAAHRRAMAVKGTVLATIVLLVFAVIGETVLHALRISLPAFRIAGGVLLFLLAVDMVFARPSSGLRAITRREDAEAATREDISVFPLAVPLLAGPGAITSVLLVMDRTGHEPAHLAVALAVLLAIMALTLLTLLFAAEVTRLLGVTGTNVIGRVLGILLAALAAQWVIDGLRAVGLPT